MPQPVSNNVLRNLLQNRQPAAHPTAPSLPQPDMSSLDAQIRNARNAEPWTYYDTFRISSYTGQGDQGASNFSAVPSPMPFFKDRTIDSHGLAITNMTSKDGKFDVDFRALYIAVDVFGPSALPSTKAFVEAMIQSAALQIKFGDVPKLYKKLIELPSGGGLHVGAQFRTQATAADSDSADANNGVPSAQSLMMLAEPIIFRQTDSFSVSIVIDPGSGSAGPLAAIRALTALSGSQTAGVAVRIGGVRGKDLLRGTPAAR